MNFNFLPFGRAFSCRLASMTDSRGSFSKYFGELFQEHLPDFDIREVFLTKSLQGVLRGLHFQAPPKDQSKLVCVVSGSVFETVVDIRGGSPTYGQATSLYLDSSNPDFDNCIFVPSGFAHGYVVLEDHTEVLYCANHIFDASLDGGIHWRSVESVWQHQPTIVSEKDASLPLISNFQTPFNFAD
jgi:dTDP-4-dehydrorhamnose 3,5-epimerase